MKLRNVRRPAENIYEELNEIKKNIFEIEKKQTLNFVVIPELLELLHIENTELQKIVKFSKDASKFCDDLLKLDLSKSDTDFKKLQEKKRSILSFKNEQQTTTIKRQENLINAHFDELEKFLFCLEIHHENIRKFNAFETSANEIQKEIRQIKADFFSINEKRFAAQIQAKFLYLKNMKTVLADLENQASSMCAVQERNCLRPNQQYSVQCLTETKEIGILLDISTNKTNNCWKIKLKRGEITDSSFFFTILPKNNYAIDIVDELKLSLLETIAIYSNSVRSMKEIIVSYESRDNSNYLS